MEIEVIVENKIQYDYLINKNNIDTIIVSRDCFIEKEIINMIKNIKYHNKKAYIRLERISRFDEEYKKDNRLIKDENIYEYKNILNIEGLDGVLIQNIDSFYNIMKCIQNNKIINNDLSIELDYSMNIYNIETKKFFDNFYNKCCTNDEKLYKVISNNSGFALQSHEKQGRYHIGNLYNKLIRGSHNKIQYTYPIELSIKDMQELNMDTLVVYSHLPVMISANCVYKTLGKCECNKVGMLKDRMDEKVYYKSYCKYCYSKIFNPAIYYIADIINDNNIMNNLHFSKIRYEFTICNNIKEIDNAIRQVLNNKNYLNTNFYQQDSSNHKNSDKKLNKNENIDIDKKFSLWTRGHIKKSIE